MDTWAGVAQAIIEGFDQHYSHFRQYSREGKECFARADWSRAAEVSRERIQGYERRVRETVDRIKRDFPAAAENNEVWPRIKIVVIGKLMDHLQSECAETFYNSVACRVLHRDYYKSEYIFWRPAISTQYLRGSQPTYRSYYPGSDGLRRSLLDILTSFQLPVPFENLRRDIRYLERALLERRSTGWKEQPNHQIQVLRTPFFRNKAAYLVGRLINGDIRQPFVIPVLRNEDETITVDALLMQQTDVAVLFSFSRAYFLVDMEVPSAYVAFLLSIMPQKSVVDLYAMLGLQKQAKTIFYRELQHHLRHSRDNFQVAPGVRGMVMLVFTLPSMPFVFKLIKDKFDPPKTVSRQVVEEKYLLVKNHDRVGRLADTLEYSNVAIPIDRIDPVLLNQLQTLAASSIEIDGDMLVIKHIYIERRMEPLDNYLAQATRQEKKRAIRDYGNAIRDLAGANIFPGDMLKKNFGVTRHDRVVFYDYDEICYITECNFRRIPPARDYDDMMSDTPWYSVKENDVFPETFGPFFFANEKDMALFRKNHTELMTPEWWKQVKEDIESGRQADIFPYRKNRRFQHRYG
ncbi:MAG: bifunctional isocitrate dehydrogenase kinase/phosphatase [Xanthomonadales bacterium]|nr:bifunctional isocitrate dehydrogenase kinase/phosphatase [Gammaproteobacteria bacterium]MBT8053953.1 bifunctional isocitrate dehydrogenase kinase/phosphatase [Gammaproteobacteria bacterium]NND58294.1 bifunctional isocitrate dehydrogenase kinase/phosphatase [Xanthomonadales bacterium]NNK51995.1 bifunctional isocitrate dehydrogenase kinase/phosphatase [Xanthomonadales bacterium]